MFPLDVHRNKRSNAKTKYTVRETLNFQIIFALCTGSQCLFPPFGKKWKLHTTISSCCLLLFFPFIHKYHYSLHKCAHRMGNFYFIYFLFIKQKPGKNQKNKTWNSRNYCNEVKKKAKKIKQINNASNIYTQIIITKKNMYKKKKLNQ